MKSDQLTEYLDELSRIMNYNLKQIIISIFFITIILIIGSYVLYKIIDTVNNYRNTNQQYAKMKQTSMAPGKDFLLDPSNDNNEINQDPNDNLGETDEYEKITRTIQKKFAEYQNYNKSLASHYKDVRNKDAPDVIDQTSMNAANDNW